MKPITEIEEIKRIELDIMRSIHNFCFANHITYFLSHGSLLGAIRHKGFIPWDDDIDIFMPRNDYETFCKLFPQVEHKYNLKLTNSESIPYYGRPMSKVFDTRTVVVETNYVGDDPIGVNIDIWPLDGVPSNEKEKKKHLKKIKILQMLLYGRVVKMKACKGMRKKIIHLALLPLSSHSIVRKVTSTLKKIDYTNSTEITCAIDPYKQCYPKEWFAHGILSDFEKEQFYIPVGAQNILKTIYGDYTILPPEVKRTPHHCINAYWR